MVPQNPKEAERAGLDVIVQLFIVWLELHHLTCPPGPDCHEPLNVLAWLAHRGGVKVKDAAKFSEYLRWYEEHCANCSHLRN